MSLDNMPHEITFEVASYLSDSDVISLALTCKQLHVSIAMDSSPLWRVLFNDLFNPSVLSVPNNAVAMLYQHCKSIMHHSCYHTIRDGRSPTEKELLGLVRNLILSSSNPYPDERSKNVDVLYRICGMTDLLRNICSIRRKPGRALMAVQVTLANFMFDKSLNLPTLGFNSSQKKMYASPLAQPLFKGREKAEVNLEWVLHALNFFKHYTFMPGAELENAYQGLSDDSRISEWCGSPKTGTKPLGLHWLGTYAYLEPDEIDTLRSNNTRAAADLLEDRFSEEPIQSLEVVSVHLGGSSSFVWRPTFEGACRALSHPSVEYMTKRQKKLVDAKAANLAKATKQPQKHPQTRPKTTRAQLRDTPSSVLDQGPERVVSQHNALSGPSPGYTLDMAACQLATSSICKGSDVHLSGKYPEAVIAEKNEIQLQFLGVGEDEEWFLHTGWTTALPPQHGIPGFRRFTMMKFFAPEEESPPTPTTPTSASENGLPSPRDSCNGDEEPVTLRQMNQWADWAIENGMQGLWAYEGVVLPGGNVIVGRWWSPGSGSYHYDDVEGEQDDGAYLGPFILWNTDTTEEHCIGDELKQVIKDKLT